MLSLMTRAEKTSAVWRQGIWFGRQCWGQGRACTHGSHSGLWGTNKLLANTLIFFFFFFDFLFDFFFEASSLYEARGLPAGTRT